MSKWEIEVFEYASIEEMKQTILKFIDDHYRDNKIMFVINRELNEGISIGKVNKENMRQAEIIRDALNKGLSMNDRISPSVVENYDDGISIFFDFNDLRTIVYGLDSLNAGTGDERAKELAQIIRSFIDGK